MSALLAATVLLVPQSVKHVTLDDFQAGPYTVTLAGGQSDAHAVLGLDPRHCIFGQRRTHLDINNNVNQTTLTLAIGDGVQSLTSPKQVAWFYYLAYGGDGLVDVDLSWVDWFMLDLDHIPDILSMSVTDTNWKGGGNGGWLLKPGGVYFRRSAFSGNVDWKHISYLRIRQDFGSFPNTLSYRLTRFYASAKPGALPPSSRIDRLGLYR